MWSNLEGLFQLYHNTVLFGMVFALVNYLILCGFLVRFSKAKKLQAVWRCWIPVLNLWMLGKIINHFKIGNKVFDKAEYRLVVSSVVLFMVIKVPIIGPLVGVAYCVLVMSCGISLWRQTESF